MLLPAPTLMEPDGVWSQKTCLYGVPILAYYKSNQISAKTLARRMAVCFPAS